MSMDPALHHQQELERRLERVEERLLALEGLLARHLLSHPQPAQKLPLVGETT